MNLSIALTPADLLKLFARLLMRYHVVTYTVVVLGGLSVVIFMTYQIIIDNTTSPQASPTQTTTSSATMEFDQATIQKLRELNEQSNKAKPLTFPTDKRINPFVD